MFSCATSFGQELITIRDTIHQFEIGVPSDWKYGVPKNNSLAFMAVSQKSNSGVSPRENFNLNIFQTDLLDFDYSYQKFLKSISIAKEFKIIEQGEKIINQKKYKFLIETHKNVLTEDDMMHYIFFNNNNGRVAILTMVTVPDRFERFKSLFDSIAATLRY